MTKLWTGVGDWSTATGWSPIGIPNATDDVIVYSGAILFDSTGAYQANTINNFGSLTIYAGYSLTTQLFTNSAGTTVVNGTLTTSTVYLTGGTFEIGVATSLAASTVIAFRASPATVKFDFAPQSGKFSSYFSGFSQGDTIDLTNVAFAGTQIASSTTANGVESFNIENTFFATLATLAFAGPYQTSDFTLAQDSGTGTLIGMRALVDIVGGKTLNLSASANGRVYLNAANAAADNVAGDGGAIFVAANVTANVIGAHDVVTETGTANVGLFGAGDTVNAPNGGTLWLNAVSGGASYVANAAGCTIAVSAGVTADVFGAYNVIYENGVANVGVSGFGNRINAGVGGNFWLNSGHSLIVNSTSANIAVSAGVQATVNGAANIITAYGDADITLGGAGNLLNDSFGGTVTLVGAAERAYVTGGAISLLGGASSDVVGTNNTITESGGTFNLGITGSNNTVNTTSGGNLWLNGGTNEIVNSSSNTIAISAGVLANIFGDSNLITEYGAANVGIFGSNDLVNANSGGNIWINSGVDDALNATGANVAVAAGESVTVNGASDVITEYGAATILFTGSNGTINANSGGAVLVSSSGTGNFINATGASVHFFPDAHAEIKGDGNTISQTSIGPGIPAKYFGGISGSNNTINTDIGDIWLNSGTGNTVNSKCANIAVSANVGVTVNGASNIATEYGAANVTLSGSKNTLNASSGGAITISSGTGHVVNATGATIAVGAGVGATISGASNSINTFSSTSLTISGSKNSINANGQCDLFFNGGTGESVTGSGAAIYLNAAGSATVSGSSQQVFLYSDNISVTMSASTSTVTAEFTGGTVTLNASAAISDLSKGLHVNVMSGVGVDLFSGFGADSSAIIDLFNGVGGYTSAAAAFAALTSDGAGGEKLSLGGAGNYIDFVNTTTLNVNNFKIG